jgi:hypothetical protein
MVSPAADVTDVNLAWVDDSPEKNAALRAPLPPTTSLQSPANQALVKNG